MWHVKWIKWLMLICAWRWTWDEWVTSDLIRSHVCHVWILLQIFISDCTRLIVLSHTHTHTRVLQQCFKSWQAKTRIWISVSHVMYLRKPVVLLARLSSVSLSLCCLCSSTWKTLSSPTAVWNTTKSGQCVRSCLNTHTPDTHTCEVFKCCVASVIRELVCDWSNLCLSEHIQAQSSPLTCDMLSKLGGDVDLQGGGSDETADDDSDLPLNHDIITVRMTQILKHTDRQINKAFLSHWCITVRSL